MDGTILHTRNGRLDSADRPRFDELLVRLGQSPKDVLIHLHGGLVDEKDGEAIARRLMGTGDEAYRAPADWEQVYIVWRTGPFETIRTNWRDLADNDRLYKALRDRLLGFLSSKLLTADGRSVAAATGLSPAEIKARLASGSDAPFADIDALAADPGGGRGLAIDDEDEQTLNEEFTISLQSDPEFTGAVEDIDAALNPVREGRGLTSGLGDEAAGRAILRRLGSDVSNELEAQVAVAEGRGVFTSTVLLKELITHGAAIMYRVYRRFRTGRDHGFHATIVEELLRELYGDRVGSAVWSMMKQDAADHFRDDGFGAELLNALAAGGHRVRLVGHSAGAIWVTEALRKAPAGVTYRVGLLAPAVRTNLFAEMLASSSAAIAQFRLFGMSDRVERKDPVLGKGFGAIYPSSLLYLVSGLFEERGSDALVDAPLLGLHRFHGGVPAWLSEADERSALQEVQTFLGGFPQAAIWSRVDGGPGLSTQATSHGGIDGDRPTLDSVMHLLA
jgi:hypothetical protein